MREDQQHHAQHRRHEDVAAAEQRPQIPQVGPEDQQRDQRRHDREGAAEERRAIGQRQRARRLTPAGHGVAVVGGQGVDRRTGCVDQNRRDRPAIHRRAVDPEQQHQRHQIGQEYGCGQQDGDGNRRTNARHSPDDQPTDRTNQQRDQHLRIEKIAQTGHQCIHQKYTFMNRSRPSGSWL